MYSLFRGLYFLKTLILEYFAKIYPQSYWLSALIIYLVSTVIPRFTRFSITRFSITRFFVLVQKNLYKDKDKSLIEIFLTFFKTFFLYTMTCITRISIYAVIGLPQQPRKPRNYCSTSKNTVNPNPRENWS